MEEAKIHTHDTHIKFKKDCFRYSKAGIHRQTDSMVIAEAYFHFLRNKGNRLIKTITVGNIAYNVQPVQFFIVFPQQSHILNILLFR
jgi:hypothetical protein